MERQLQKLTEMATDIQRLEARLQKKRQTRNRLALSLVDNGRYSLRKIAAHAGIANTYLVQLRKKDDA